MLLPEIVPKCSTESCQHEDLDNANASQSGLKDIGDAYPDDVVLPAAITQAYWVNEGRNHQGAVDRQQLASQAP